MSIEQKRLLICIIIAVLLTIGLVQPLQPQTQEGIVISEERAETREDSISQPERIMNEIVVHVAGAVENPGVYTLQEGQRVEDAIQLAGILPNAAEDTLNRAAPLTDGVKIVVPYQDDVGLQPTNDHSETTQHKLNLNQATLAQLMTLPGIGEVKAQAIIRYRQEHGRFQNVDQLLSVNGIGTAIYSQIVDLVCV